MPRDEEKSLIREQMEMHKRRKEHLIATGKIRPKLPTAQALHENIVVGRVVLGMFLWMTPIVFTVKPREEVPLHLYLEEQGTPPQMVDAQTETDEFLEVFACCLWPCLRLPSFLSCADASARAVHSNEAGRGCGGTG